MSEEPKKGFDVYISHSAVAALVAAVFFYSATKMSEKFLQQS